MRRKEDIFQASGWLEKADMDLRRVSLRLEEGDKDDAAFHLQQAIEKYLKAFLLAKGWQLRKVHDLEALLDEAIRYAPSLEKFRSVCAEVTGYYMVERYPSFVEGPSIREISAGLKKAGNLARMIKAELQDKGGNRGE
ncbi:MAG: HEPN domain-containing protein [Deltaproteobacteria bacterium]|nr:HEPN domain-containing protein [Deltaproteobacteria bacterium]